jgi:integrase
MFHEEKRERFLTADEIARLNQALMNEPDWRWRAFLLLILLLGTRRGEFRHGPLGRHGLRAGRVAHSEYQVTGTSDRRHRVGALSSKWTVALEKTAGAGSDGNASLCASSFSPRPFSPSLTRLFRRADIEGVYSLGFRTV